jgi:hypothetical protein
MNFSITTHFKKKNAGKMHFLVTTHFQKKMRENAFLVTSHFLVRIFFVRIFSRK